MDFATFKEKLLSEDLKSLTTPQQLQDCLLKKYPDVEIQGTYRLNKSHIAIYFKHKLWHKLAIFRGDEWVETRVNSLKNQLPEDTEQNLVKQLKKALTIVRMECVIPADSVFYYYIIAKISGKKFVLHVSREGDVLLKSKFVEYNIKLDDDDDDDDTSNDEDDDMDDDDAIEEVELVAEEEDMD